jgi:hypothetical protein
VYIVFLQIYAKNMIYHIFSFLRNLHTDFHSGCINLHSHQYWLRVPFPCIFDNIYCCLFSLWCPIWRVSWSLTAVLICIPFMAEELEHCFMYLVVTFISSSENCLFNSLD